MNLIGSPGTWRAFKWLITWAKMKPASQNKPATFRTLSRGFILWCRPANTQHYSASCLPFFPSEALRLVHTIQFWSNYHLKPYCVWWNMLVFAQSNFSIQLFCDNSKETQKFLFWEFMLISPQLGPAVVAILWKYLAGSSMGKSKSGCSLDLVGWK